MRTSLFAILGPLDDLSFLDLFSGSGLVGIEAASRGASPIDLVEKDTGKKAGIRRNLAWVDEAVRLHLADVRVFLKAADRRWDLIYADPPFPLADKLAVLELIERRNLLAEGGRLILHYPVEETFPQRIGTLNRSDHRSYGRSQLVFYTRDEAPAAGD